VPRSTLGVPSKRSNTSGRHRLLLIGALAIWLAATIGQVGAAQPTQLFEPATSAEARAAGSGDYRNPSGTQQVPYERLVGYVRVNIDALANSSAVDIRLTCQMDFVAVRSRIDVRSDSAFTWFGSITEPAGTAIFVVDRGRVTGTISAGIHTYRISPVGSTKIHAITELQYGRLPPEDSPR
jgi:hypothetical protein